MFKNIRTHTAYLQQYQWTIEILTTIAKATNATTASPTKHMTAITMMYSVLEDLNRLTGSTFTDSVKKI